MRKVRGALLAAVMVAGGMVAGVPHATAAGNYQVSIDDVPAQEGTILAFVVSVSPFPAASDSVSVTATTNNGTATGGAACPAADFITQSATVVMTSQSPTAEFNVTTCDDTTDEPDETMNVTLSSPSANCVNTPSPCTASIADGTGVGTIFDNDATTATLPPTETTVPSASPVPTGPPGPPTFVAVDVNGPVGPHEDCRFSINRLGDASGIASVTFFTKGKAKLVTNVSGTLVFTAGETVKVVDVDVLRRPRRPKFVELFLAGAQGATISDGLAVCELKTKHRRRR